MFRSEESRQVTPPSIPSNSAIFHYADAAGLKGILETNSLWLTDRVHLNDPTEISFGMRFATDWCEQQAMSDDRVARLFFRTFGAGLPRLLDQLGGYVGAFSLEPEVLSQWCRYADDGRGFCIEFAAGALNNQWAEHSGPGHLSLYRVDYRETEIAARQLSCMERASTFLKRPEVRTAMADEEARRQLIVGMHAATARALLWNAMQFKHGVYREESEARVLIMAEAQTAHSSVSHKIRVRGSELVSYIDLPCAPPLRTPAVLKTIIVGPAAPASGVAGVGALLNATGVKGVIVRESNIPYRSMR